MAMYTKMTATGSSLIVAPRTISKELEQKIAGAVADYMAKNDTSKLTTKQVRQAVEKEIHVSLANHKETVKRLMHQEFRKIKAHKVARRIVPDPWKMKLRREAMHKAMKYIYSWLMDTQNFDRWGLHALQHFYDLQRIESGETHRLATFYTRQLGAYWLNHTVHEKWDRSGLPTPAQVVELMLSVIVVERIGISHARRVELLQFFDRSPPAYNVLDFLGWDPSNPSTLGDDPQAVYKKMTNSLWTCYYAHMLNVPMGCTVSQLIQYLPPLYPYKGPDEISPEVYHQQLQMIVSIVMILTNFGALKCEPELLPHEYFVLRHHLVYFIARQDIATVAEILKALRCFSGADNLVQVRRGQALLLVTQNSTGTWELCQSDQNTATAYFVATSAIRALCEPCTTGFAPSIPDLVPLLELHLNADIGCPAPSEKQPRDTVEKEKLEGTKDLTPAKQMNHHKVDTNELKKDPSRAEEEDLVTQVKFHQGMLEQDSGGVKNVPAALAANVLQTLNAMPLTLEILKTTGVGKVINKLRKHNDESVAKRATDLVAKWKKSLL